MYYSNSWGTKTGRFIYAIAISVITVFLFSPPAVANEIIDDFEGNGLVDVWWASDSIAPYVYNMDFGNTEHVHSGSTSLKVVYDKANDPDNAYSPFFAMGGYSLRNYDYLSFWVYNDGSPLTFNIRFEDVSGTAWEVSWSGAELPHTLDTAANWENLVVDLTRAFGDNSGIDWSRIKQIVFMAQPGDSTASGTFWMDDIVLSRAPTTAPLESFENDFYGWAAGGCFSLSNVTDEYQNSNGPADLGHKSLKVTWGAKGANYDNFTYQTIHDSANAPLNRIGNFPDLRQYGNYLVELWVKSLTDNNIPILLKFDNTDWGIQHYTGAGAWQKLTWNITPYKIDPELVYFFPYPNQADNGGVMYIDNLCLTGGAGPVIPDHPGNLRVEYPDINNKNNYRIRWDAVPSASNYHLQEADSIDFNNATNFYPTGTYIDITNSPPGRHYYRVRSNIHSTVDNYGCFSKSIMVFALYPPPTVTNEIIDDFEGNGLVNVWWASDPKEPYVYNMTFGDTEHVHSGSKSLKIVYNKANEDTEDARKYAPFYAMGGYNLKNYDYLSFWVYNDGSPLTFNIRFEDASGKSWELSWAGMELPHTLDNTANWENMVVDLTRTFGDISGIDWSQIKQIIFMAQPEDQTASGTFWLDDIVLSRAPTTAPLESFENDFYGWAAGGCFSLSHVTDQYQNSNGPADLGHKSLKVTWGAKGANYDNFTYDNMHDSTGAPLNRIGNYPDLSHYGNYLVKLWVKSLTNNNIPILLKFSNADWGTQNYTGNGDWQELSWDITLYGANPDLVYFFPYPNQAASPGAMYIDNLCVTGGSGPVVPIHPSNLRVEYTDINNSSNYRIRWDAMPSASNYHLQEADNLDFNNANNFYPSGTYLDITNSAPGIHYYRVRSNIPSGGDNYGCFSKYISTSISKQTNYDPNAPDLGPGKAVNDSYYTDCAEFDNVNVPLFKQGVNAFRITTTNTQTDYGQLDVRAPDYQNFAGEANPFQWIGTDNKQNDGFKYSGYSNGDVYYFMDKPDDPPSPTNEPVSEFPNEINNSSIDNPIPNHIPITDQIIAFTTQPGAETNHSGFFTPCFANVHGELEIEVFTANDFDISPDNPTWVSRGTETYTETVICHTWGFPDGTWTSSAPHADAIKMHVVAAGSTVGAYGLYDNLMYAGGDDSMKLFDNAIVIVDAAKSNSWWRKPHSMTVSVLGGKTMPGATSLTIAKKFYDTDGWGGFFVLYEDGNTRIAPFAPLTVAKGWIPYGPSVILGPIQNLHLKRPYTDIKAVDIDPYDCSMDLTFYDDSTAHVEIYVDRNNAVMDVSNITYDTTANPFMVLRSMWVKDGNGDIDSVFTADNRYSQLNWKELPGEWWFFNREVTSYHNTLSPDFRVNIISPNPAYLIRQAETPDSGSGYSVAPRNNAVGGQVLVMSDAGAEAVYNINLEDDQPESYLRIRYSDTAPDNEVSVYLDGTLKGTTMSMCTASWSSFELTPEFKLGDLGSGYHQIRVTTSSGSQGIDLDQIELVSFKTVNPMPPSILTRQAESMDSGYGYETFSSGNAEGGKYICMAKAGGAGVYNINLPHNYKDVYMQVRYADAQGAVSEAGDDGAGSRIDRTEIYVDDMSFSKAKFPSVTTGGWDTFNNTPFVYIGDLAYGPHEIEIFSACTAEMIANPGLEDGTLNEWSPWCVSYEATALTKHSGNYSAKVALSTEVPEGAAIREIPEKRKDAISGYNVLNWHVGDRVQASAWIKTDAGLGGAGASVRVEFVNGSVPYVESQVLTGVHDWTKLSIDTTVPSGTTSIKYMIHLTNGVNGNYAYFDDASLTFMVGDADYAISLDRFEIIGTEAAPTQGAISGTVNLQSRTNQAELITFELRNPGETTPVKTLQMVTGSDGKYIFWHIDPGTYDLTAKASNSLREKVAGVAVTVGQETPDIDFSLLGGDANGDNSIGTSDMLILRSAWLTHPGDAAWDKRADFNNDGSIGTSDMIILKNNWLKHGDN